MAAETSLMVLQLDNKKINHLILKWAKDLNSPFFKEDEKMANSTRQLFDIIIRGPSLMAQMVKNPPVMQETQVWSLGQ